MTPEKRVDRIKTFIGEVAAQLDLHTAQLRRADTGIATLIETTARQSDDSAFLRQGQAEQRDQITQLTVSLGKRTTKVDTYQTEINTKLDGCQQILTASLNAVQRPSGN